MGQEIHRHHSHGHNLFCYSTFFNIFSSFLFCIVLRARVLHMVDLNNNNNNNITQKRWF